MTPKTILILTAMDSEFKDALSLGNFTESKLTRLEIPLFHTTTGKNQVYIAKTGIGPINSSFVTGTILQEYPIDLVVLLGLGGAVDSRLKLGDVCIATNIIQHDAICSFDDHTEQMACGEHHLSLKPHERPDIKIQTESLINEKLGEYLRQNNSNVYSGDILSGSEFCGSYERKLNLKERFKNSILVEMEAAGVAYMCKRFKVPFCVIKTVADTVSKGAASEYVDFLNSNTKKCTDVYNFFNT